MVAVDGDRSLGLVEQTFGVHNDTVRTNEDVVSSRHLPIVSVRPHLFVVMECDRVWSGGARYELTHVDEVVVCRGSERSFSALTDDSRRRARLAIPGRSLSSVHARIIRRGVEWVFEDAGSTNGSRVNGQAVKRRVLEDGDLIEVGHTFLTLRLALPTSTGTPSHFDSQAPSRSDVDFATLHPQLTDRYADLAKVARSNVPVVLRGNTGTGKEVAARAIHRLSGRTGPFVAVNCGALVPSLLESQLFGHSQGAFSGAVRDEIGLIRSADKGTLLLDEIGDLPLSSQVSLLRVLQESEVTPVGKVRAVRVDVRVIAATQRPLHDQVAHGRFREDLRSRLEGYVLELPTLGERREDLGILVGRILEKLTPNPPALRPSAARLLLDYDWPLNIRELEQVLRRSLALSGGESISTRHFPESIAKPAASSTFPVDHFEPIHGGVAKRKTLSAADQELRARLIESLRRHRGNVSQVARSTGKARCQIQRWIRRLAIEGAEYLESEPPS